MGLKCAILHQEAPPRLFSHPIRGSTVFNTGGSVLKPSKPNPIVRGSLWTATLAWYAVCLYLSWQNGEDTFNTSWNLANVSLEVLKHFGIRPDLHQFHTYLRLVAHFGIFFVAGGLQASAMARSSQKHRYLLSAGISSLVAVAGEVGKINIPGRHLQWDETGLNVIGAVCGVLLVKAAKAVWDRRHS